MCLHSYLLLAFFRIFERRCVMKPFQMVDSVKNSHEIAPCPLQNKNMFQFNDQLRRLPCEICSKLEGTSKTTVMM